MKTLVLVTPAVFLVDQAVKLFVVATVPLGERVPVIPNLFDIVHTVNRGAAFGIFSNLPDSIRTPFFLISSLVALGLIILFYLRSAETHPTTLVALSLILGGALGNIFDRIFRGAVVDFLSFHWYDRVVSWEIGPYYGRLRLEWPAFNVADAAISVAVFWLVIRTLRGKK